MRWTQAMIPHIIQFSKILHGDVTRWGKTCTAVPAAAAAAAVACAAAAAAASSRALDFLLPGRGCCGAADCTECHAVAEA